MAKPIVVLMNWIYMQATQMAAFAHQVASRMVTAKAAAPSPVTPEALNEAANRLELAYGNRMNGPEARTELENAETALDDLLHTQAAYVNSIANGDVVVIEAAGFVATNNSRKKPVIPATPGAASLKGNATSLHLSIPAVTGAANYCWVIFTGTPSAVTVADNHIVIPSGGVIVIPEGGAREELRGIITEGTKISVQVLAQNSAGKSGFSPMVSFTVGG